MDSFENGSHVVLELDDDSRCAGFLINPVEQGFILRITHKDRPALYTVSPERGAAIRAELRKVPLVLLGAALVAQGVLTGLGRRETMVEALAKLQEAEVLEEHYEKNPTVFHELSVPVLTFINGGAVKTIELSDDVTEDLTVMDFKQEMDAGIEGILKQAEEAVASDDVAEVIDEGDVVDKQD